MFREVPASKTSIDRRKPIYGLGINDAKYTTAKIIDGKELRCPYYRKWKNMLTRCYSASYQEKQPTYIDCTVCDEWLTFSNFKEWMIKQDWKDKQLDKDILVQGNKLYSPEKCLFVSKEINLLLTDRKAKRGKYPIGVYWHGQRENFMCLIGVNGNNRYLGSFNTPEQAHEIYKKAKYRHIKNIADQQDEPLRSALLAYKIV